MLCGLALKTLANVHTEWADQRIYLQEYVLLIETEEQFLNMCHLETDDSPMGISVSNPDTGKAQWKSLHAWALLETNVGQHRTCIRLFDDY